MDEVEVLSDSATTQSFCSYELDVGEEPLDENTIQRHYNMLNYVYERQALKESLSIIFWFKFKLSEYGAEVNESPFELKMEFFSKILKNVHKYKLLNSFEFEYFSLWNFSSDSKVELLKSNDLTIGKDFVYWNSDVPHNIDDDEQNAAFLPPLLVEKKLAKKTNHVYSYKLPPKVYQYFYLVTTTEAEKQEKIQLTDDAIRTRIFAMPPDFDWHNALKMYGHVLGEKSVPNQLSELSDISSNISASTSINRPIRRRSSTSSSLSSIGSRRQSMKISNFYSNIRSRNLSEFRRKLEQRSRGTQPRLGRKRRRI